MHYYQKTAHETLKLLGTSDKTGLTKDEISKRQDLYGKNSLPAIKKVSALVKFIKQFSDILVLVLLSAALISFILGEFVDGIVVISIVILNGIMGYIQEAKAEKALEALKKMSTDFTKVIRDSNPARIPTVELVPGDIVILESGDKIPADCRLLEAVNLELSESILTGESMPVKKRLDPINKENPGLAEMTNMVFKDTAVLNGRGLAIVTATGTSTEIGKISQMLESTGTDEAPLTKQLDSVGKKLSLFAGIIIVVIFVVGLLSSRFNLREAFFTAVSLAVAAIPEGLPAIVTIVLAIGVSRLSKVNAIIRKLNAVETLGSTSFILTDKTGTLTQNKMTVTHIALADEIYNFDSSGILTNESGQRSEAHDHNKIVHLLNSAVLCSDVQVINSENDENKYLGDSTEVALVICAAQVGIDVRELKQTYQRIFEIPFSSDSKKMLVVVKDPIDNNKVIAITKGAPEIVADLVMFDTEEIKRINSIFTQQGLRSLAFSFKELSIDYFNELIASNNINELESKHEFMGIMAQQDPLRPEIKSALHDAHMAGIETIMLTGDNRLTAIAIAREIGLITDNSQAINGIEIQHASQNELTVMLEKARVFARVSPEQKLNIVQALKSQGKIVAVTGDGVNDAPAIKTADIGIAMGLSGTDVAKGAADMVLQDDNYATIVEAIKQGRIVYDNLVKFIRYLVSCNISEILVVGIAVFAGLPLPLLPIQILWINLVTDGFPALSLGIEPGERDIMARKPRNPHEEILTPKRWLNMLFESLLITVGSLVAYVYALSHYNAAIAQTAVLTTLALSQIFHTFNNRSEKHSLTSKHLEHNYNLYLVVCISSLLQLAVVYTSLGNTLFKTQPLDLQMLSICLVLSLSSVVGVEITKAFKKFRKQVLY